MSIIKLAITAASFPMAVYMGYLWGQGKFNAVTILTLGLFYVAALINAYQAGRK